MESVLPGGLGTGALGGALDVMPDLGSNPMAAPDAPTSQSPAAGPKSPTSVGLPPLGF